MSDSKVSKSELRRLSKQLNMASFDALSDATLPPSPLVVPQTEAGSPERTDASGSPPRHVSFAVSNVPTSEEKSRRKGSGITKLLRSKSLLQQDSSTGSSSSLSSSPVSEDEAKQQKRFSGTLGNARRKMSESGHSFLKPRRDERGGLSDADLDDAGDDARPPTVTGPSDAAPPGPPSRGSGSSDESADVQRRREMLSRSSSKELRLPRPVRSSSSSLRPVQSHDNAEAARLLQELRPQAAVSRSRSDSLSRIKDSAASLGDVLTLSGSPTRADERRLSRGLTTRPRSDSSPSTSPAISPSGSPRASGSGAAALGLSSAGVGGSPSSSSSNLAAAQQTRPSSSSRVRSVTKSLEQLESGDTEGWKASLLDSRFVLVGALFDAANEDDWTELAESLVSVFEQGHRTIKLIIWALRNEVATTAHPHDMFRLDSAASKLMGAYGQLVAGAFVKDLLRTTVLKKAAKVLGKAPTGGEELPVSAVWKIIDDMLAQLLSRLQNVPFQLRVLCYYINEEVVRRFPGKGNIGVGGFVFLRLICPAIVAPEKRGIVKQEPTIPMRKVQWAAPVVLPSNLFVQLLVRVARELQQLVNIANRGEALSIDLYGESTEQVTFVGCNVQRIKGFLDNVGTKTLEEDTKPTLPALIRGKSFASLSSSSSGDSATQSDEAMAFIAALARRCDLLKAAAAE